MNGIVQLVVNPFLQNKMGSDNFGVVLSLISVVSIVAISFGTSFNYSRMIASSKKRNCNSDYFLFLILTSLICIPVCIISLKFFNEFSLPNIFLYSILCIFTLFRYYADVNYRLNSNFKGFFLFYFLMSLGYLAGVAFFSFSKSWAIIYILAEALALIYVFIKGDVFKCNPLNITPEVKSNFKSAYTLILSNFISSAVANIDRPLILKFIDANSVTVFYVATLIGKCVSLLTAPLNGVIISYLVKYEGKLEKVIFKRLNLILLPITILLSVVCILISHIFINLMYPNVYAQAKPLIAIAIIGQMFYFVSGTVMVVLMRFTKESVLLTINTLHFFIYIVSCLIGITTNGLYGFAIGILFANISRMILAYVFGMIELNKAGKQH